MTVAEAAELAVGNSADLRAERESIELRYDAWKLGFRSYLPSIELAAGSDERLSIFGSDSFTKTLSLAISQPVWDGGRRATVRALESAEIVLSRAEFDRKVRDVGEAAVAAYRSVIAARAKLDIKRSSLASAGYERAILATEVRLGLGKASDLLEADLRLSGMEIEIVEAELSVSVAEAELAEAMGVYDLPGLSERLDPERAAIRIGQAQFAAAAVERSSELETARYGLAKKRAEARVSAFAWLPTIGLKASGQVSGTEFPLTRAIWSLGLTMDFAHPYISGSAGASGGGEPPYESNASSKFSVTPIPDPAGVVSFRNAKLALKLEEEKYVLSVAKVRRTASSAVIGYFNSLRKKDIGASSLALAEARLELVKLQVGMGQATRSDAVEAELDRSGKETELVDAVTAVVAAERVLEKLLDLSPDTLGLFLDHFRDGAARPGESTGGGS